MSAPDLRARPGRRPGLSALVGRVLGSPALYNLLQRLCGAEHTLRRLRPLLADTAGRRVLDVGGGTGVALSLLPEPRHYLWLDSDPAKLRGLQTVTTSGVHAVLGDATRLPLRPRSVDVALCLAMSHHLADAELEAMLGELARVVSHRLVFLDAVVTPALRSRLLWAIDRGRHPRSAGALRAALERRFRILSLEEYAVHHRYLLCTAAPLG